ncbi:hypothetical protein BATDEDRAFT_88119 [Batrachochytrium dendrobatidis JAM81]|uniref:FHA domain-containing protein n=1 Tax=Batrachochytrium dendrobatidis (strain JAM81 / FGSC 10211) TaxID=684364 RepID=F4P246_BATDJ|nr:uncharacterized protein BATDEDRAFT_88119 [Batrachochytrium dendrobatidis JAM81]EGF80795.1 hypothetical protein BATDEDRAFT_88119 [Batrachochytrium dendrobatidis JAM81]|eukprot:XP_006678702.1 hypothetical protein BATDEDRAFT_88119 [Batrachochytrium dendrobatidis JAM81]
MSAFPEIPVTVIPLNSSFEGQRAFSIAVGIPFIIGRSVDQAEALAGTLKFVSKVYLRDIKSSSGTFLNDQRLSPQGTESALMELKSGDIIRLGEDCEVGGVLHQSVCMKIIIPVLEEDSVSTTSVISRFSMLPQSNQSGDNLDKSALSLLDSAKSCEALDDNATSVSGMLVDSQFHMDINNEFNAVWSGLTQNLDTSLRKLKHIARKQASNMISQGMYAPYVSMAGGQYSCTSDFVNSRNSMQPSVASIGSSDALDTMRQGSTKPARLTTFGYAGGFSGSRSRQPSAMSALSATSSIGSSTSFGPLQYRIASTLPRHG